MKTFFYLIVLALLCCVLFSGFKQKRESFDRLPIHHGKCINVIKLLIDKEDGDSLVAFESFKANYLLIKDEGYVKCNIKNDDLFQYFSQDEKRNTYCISKAKLYNDKLYSK